MRTRPAGSPVVLLLLALAAVFTPHATKSVVAPAADISRVAASTHSSAATPEPRGGVEHHQSGQPVLRVAASAGSIHQQGTAARDGRMATPGLVLLQRPKPPKQRAVGATVLTPTGRSPPSPAGT